ncbi:hypothetical protein DFH06DRAFT_1219799 [Mycena polygramma]|nr:hypothetical protein DFH06DRAFT_1219799 [Mycena polygramma]
MSQFLLSPHPKQQTPAMPPSHPHTVGGDAASSFMRDEDEDNDICPVCDGECTFHITSTTTNASASSSNISAAPVASSSTAPPAVAQKLPSLKIRLTIPPNMLGKKPLPNFTKYKNAAPTTSASAVGGGTYTVSPRPSTSFASQYGTVPKKKGRPPKPSQTPRQLGLKAKSEGVPFYHTSQAARKRKPAPKKTSAPRIPAKLKGKATTVKKSAAAAKRRRIESSDESSSELSDVDNHYHFNDVNDNRSIQFPTFVSASALSSSALSSSSDSDRVSLSGFDTDSSMEAEEENFIVADENRAAEKSRVRRELLGEDGQKRRNPHNNWVIRPRKLSVGPGDVEMEVDSDATEEDDDDDDEEEQEAEEDDEVDELPVGSGYIGVATGWSEEEEESSFDADLFFANLTDSEEDEHSSPHDEIDERAEDGDQSDLDAMSLSDAALAGLIPHLRRDLENLPFELTEGWDGQVSFSNGLGVGRGLLDVDFEVHASLAGPSPSPSQDSDNEEDMETEEDGAFEGDTTDEELVGDDLLPNERAMQLFNLPFSVSSINPMSTMSPSSSPAPRNRRPFGLQSHLDSPKPADILSDNPDDFDGDMNAQSVSSRGNGPRTGNFVPDDTHTSVPSPHPRVRGRRGKSASHFGRTSPRQLHSSRQLSLPPLSQPSFQLLSSSDLTTSPELGPAHAIDLDDVLDSAYLDSEPSDEQLSASPTDQSRKQLNLSRWGWGSDTPGPSADFGSALRNSPLSSMLWQDKARARDGDRTPTNAMVHNQPPPQQDIPTKTRKESRRERRVKQKNVGLGYERPPHQQHYFRQHHPNSKTRSASSSQRTNFFNSSPPAPNL